MTADVTLPSGAAIPFTASTGFLDQIRLPSSSITSRIPGLDELRGVATLWVMVCHGTGTTTWMPTVFSGFGYHGVILFFIVSGYLITRILLSACDRGDALSTFYIRRVLRIWPLMLAALALGCWLRPEYASSVAYNFLLVNNYAGAAGVEPVFRTDVMWSLAIEEQFYLLWPLVVFLAPRGLLLPILFAVIVTGFLVDSGAAQGYVNAKATHAAMQYIGLGCAIAFGKRGLWTAIGAGALFFALFALSDATPGRNMGWPLWYGITWAMFGVCYLTVHRGTFPRSELLAHVGRLCYGLYVLHFFISWTAAEWLGRTAIVGPALYVVGSYLAALASFYLIEAPALRARFAIEQSPRLQMLLLLSGAMMALVSAIIIAGRH